jgi:hypothetical protein
MIAADANPALTNSPRPTDFARSQQAMPTGQSTEVRRAPKRRHLMAELFVAFAGSLSCGHHP